MKKIFLLSISIALMASCSVKTNEEKARELIVPDVKEHLIKPEKFEIAEFRLDSCFSDQPQNPGMFKFALDLNKIYREYKEYTEEAERAESYMSIFDNSYYQSAHEKLQENKYRSEMEKAQRKADDAKQKILQLYKDNKQLFVDAYSGNHEFIGWVATFSFRTETAGGHDIMGGAMYFLDKDLTKIIYHLSEDDFKDLEVGKSNLEDVKYEFEEELREIFKDVKVKGDVN